MLEAVDGKEQSLLIRWLPHGRAFSVIDKNRFVNEVLPQYFPKQNDYTSFQRQLNTYGFLRLYRDDDGYYHELFLRSRPSLVNLIPRPARAIYSSRQTFDPGSEPDLYAMTWLPDVALLETSAISNDSGMGNEARLSPQPPTGPPFPPSSRMPRPTRRNAPQIPNVEDPFTAIRRAMLQSYDESSTGKDSSGRSGTMPVEASNATQPSSVPDPNTGVSQYPRAAAEIDERLHDTATLEHPTRQVLGMFTGDINTSNTPENNQYWLHNQSALDATNYESSQHRNIANTAAERVDLEMMSDFDCGTKLSEWVDFLQDVDLDSSSSNTDEQKPPATHEEQEM
jgi:HSF-type DNA-binding